MGEQSAKHLRGRAMEDVIFAGSESRGPAGLAEVSLTFDAHAMPGDAAPGGVPWGAVGPEEVVVTRRLHRDGTSEYLLGGVPCRLRDIVDFFLGTGVGTKAYSIIEQGRIGFIVSSRPEDRRGLIDEAAGITKYKAKKKLAERRMEATKQHLLRVTRHHRRAGQPPALAAHPGPEGRALQALQGRAASDLELWSASQRYLGLLAEEKSLAAAAAGHGRGARREPRRRWCARTTEVEAERLALTEELTELSAAKEELFALSATRPTWAPSARQHYADEARDAARAGRRPPRRGRGAGAAGPRPTPRRSPAWSEPAVRAGQRGRVERSRPSRSWTASTTSCAAGWWPPAQRLDQATSAGGRGADPGGPPGIGDRGGRGQARRSRRRRLAALAEQDGLLVADAERVQGASWPPPSSAWPRLQERAAKSWRDRRAEAEAGLAASSRSWPAGEIELDTLREEAHRRRSRLQSLGEIQTRYESFQRGVRAIMKQYREGDRRTAERDPVRRRRQQRRRAGHGRPIRPGPKAPSRAWWPTSCSRRPSWRPRSRRCWATAWATSSSSPTRWASTPSSSSSAAARAARASSR